MAKTTIATGATDAKLAYEEKLFREMIVSPELSPLMGEGPDSCIQVKTQLERAKGETVYFHLIRKLDGAGITGSSGLALEGREEALTTVSHTLVLEEYANAVRDKGPLDRKRPFWDLDVEARTALKNWGTEKIDQLLFDALYTPTPTKIFYAGSASSIATLTASDKLTVDLLSKCKPWLLTGGNRSQNPIRPLMVNGKKMYVYLTHPDATYDLRQDSAYQQAMREAEVRGKDNPLFTGAEAVWDGFIIRTSERVPIAKTGGSGGNVPYAKGIILGAQSLLWAWGMRPEIRAEEFDYGREHGFAFDMICKAGKPKFDVDASGTAKDYGCVALYTARTSISDA